MYAIWGLPVVISSSRDSSDAGFSRATISVASTVTTMAPPRVRSHPGRDALAAPAGGVRAGHYLVLALLEDLPKDRPAAAARPSAPAPAPTSARPAWPTSGPAAPPRPSRARPSPAVLAVGHWDRRQVLTRPVGAEQRNAEERISRDHLLDGGRREPPFAVQIGERLRPIEQALAEACRGERRGHSVRPRRRGDALPQRVGLLPHQPDQLAPRRAVVEPDEAHEAEGRGDRGQNQQRAAARGGHLGQLRPSGAGEDRDEVVRAPAEAGEDAVEGDLRGRREALQRQELGVRDGRLATSRRPRFLHPVAEVT